MRVSRMFMPFLLGAVILSAAVFETPHLALAQSTIPTSSEYASGDLDVGSAGSAVLAWYAWVNINGTHTIFIALHSFQQPSPMFSVVGEAYSTASGSRVFMGNVLLAIEVYNDTDHNGYLDANYVTGTTELRYTIVMNASATFASNGVTKTLIDRVPHYSWNITYGSIQAYLINATAPYYGYGGGSAAWPITIDKLSMSYDFSVVGNMSLLKTSYHIGTIAFTSSSVSLQGLSLSLLHSTLTVASRQLAVVAGNLPYDSQSNQAASSFTGAQVNVDNVLAYEFRFKDNYTLLANPPEVHPAVYVASPIDSIPANVFQDAYFNPLVRVQNYVQGQLPDIAGLPSTSTVDFSATKFLYRINYPAWSDQAIEHDPTYVAHLSAASTLPSSLPVWIIYVAVVTGAVALLIGFNGMRRTRKTVQPLDEPRMGGPA